MKRSGKKPAPPLDEQKLRDLALHYAGKYATSRAKLLAYLRRKLRERGWGGEGEPDPEAIVERCAELKFVDDAGYAMMKASSAARRGYGVRRLDQMLHAAGIEEADAAEAREQADTRRWEAAEQFARRKRVGPFAIAPADDRMRERQIAAFIRAGHDFTTARKWVDAPPGEVPENGE